METQTVAGPSDTRQIEAVLRLINSFQKLVDSCEAARDRVQAEACLRIARELYASVRELADQVRMTYGDVPEVRIGIARLDPALGTTGPAGEAPVH